MSSELVQAQYDKLDEIANRFTQHSEMQQILQNRLNERVQALRNGGWIGRGSEAFFGEMDEIFPALGRLAQSLERASSVTVQIKRIFQEAEKEAAAPFSRVEVGEGYSRGGAAPESDALPKTIPPPRIYFVNGINSAGNVPGHIGDDQSLALKSLFDKWGVDSTQLVATPAIYLKPPPTDLEGLDFSGTHFGGLLSPIDWITGSVATGVNAVTDAGADAINRLTRTDVYSSVNGSLEVWDEYVNGPNGRYTQDTYAFIIKDLEKNPLAPGQSIVLIGHSGGGAVVANLAGMIETGKEHADVSAVITMGSPVSNYDEASRYAEVIVQVRHSNDIIGTPVIRSSESRTQSFWGDTLWR